MYIFFNRNSYIYVQLKEGNPRNFFLFPVPSKWVDVGKVKDCMTVSIRDTMHRLLFLPLFKLQKSIFLRSEICA